MEKNLVLVPGAWLGAWVWKKIIPPLEKQGYHVYPITLSGMGERFVDLNDYAKVIGSYSFDTDTVSAMKETAIILHPLPRVDEISPEVDNDPRATYFKQAENGVFVRMALIDMILGGE